MYKAYFNEELSAFLNSFTASFSCAEVDSVQAPLTSPPLMKISSLRVNLVHYG